MEEVIIKEKEKVLFIDDEESCCDIFRELMNEYYDTTICQNPIEAIQILKKYEFDAIVSDQNMPIISGIELFKKVATDAPNSAMIALTGLSDTDKIHEAINNGDIFYFIKKPWERAEMHSIIQSAIKDKQAKLELKKSEEFIKASFEQAGVGFAHLNADGSFIQINKKFSNILQIPESYILTNNIYNLITPEDRINNGIIISNLLENNNNHLSYEVNFSKNYSSKVCCKLTLSVVRDIEKQPMFIVAMLEDISATKAIENELLISHELLSQIPNAILVTDLDGNITKWIGYAEKIFGYSKEEIIGKHLSHIHSSEIKSDKTIEILSIIDKEGFFFGEIECKKKDGNKILVETIASKVYDKNNNAMAIISINQDITERKRTLKELEEYKNNLEEMVNERTKDIEVANKELIKRTEELEKFNKAMVGRELKIIKLKEEVNSLSIELEKPPPYPPVWNENKKV